jgi:hypothetical protein
MEDRLIDPKLPQDRISIASAPQAVMLAILDEMWEILMDFEARLDQIEARLHLNGGKE